RVTDTAPAHVRDVQQAVESAQVDERAEVRHVLHDALADLADQQLLHQLLELALALLLEDHATAHDDVATPLVQLDDLEIERLTDQVLDVRHAAQRDLRARQERIHAHQVDRNAALDLPRQRARNLLDLLVRRLDLLPDAQEVRLLLRQHDYAVLVLQVLQEDLDLVARLQLIRILEL